MNSGDLTEFIENYGTGLNPTLYKIPVQPGCCPTCKCIKCIYNIGPTGPQGPIGVGGESGITGPQGPIGEVGPQGVRGFIGFVGPVGLTGDIGPDGDRGFIGFQGFQGITGFIGPTGARGVQGFQGYDGGFDIRGVNTGSILMNNIPGSGNVYYSNILKAFTGGIEVTGRIIPAVTNTYSLGSSTAVWNDLHVNTGTIYVGPTGTIKADSQGNILLNGNVPNLYSYEIKTGNGVTLNPNVRSSYVSGVTGTLGLSSIAGFTKNVINIDGTPSVIQIPSGVVDSTSVYTQYALSLTGSNITLLMNSDSSKWVKLSENGLIVKS
jgi:hypothetical protein